MCHLNTLFGGVTRSRSLIKRLGRGVSSGHGKTCGRGHKGQKSRSGFSMRRGFEGGQMPLCRRLPKFGFTSRKVVFSKEIRLSVLCCIPDSTVIDLNVLKSFNIIGNKVKFVKVIMFGQIKKAIIIRGIKVTKGARSAIEAAGGKVEV